MGLTWRSRIDADRRLAQFGGRTAVDDPWTASEGLPARHPVRMGRSVGIPSCLSAHRALRSPKWKAASTIVEGLFHSAQFFCGRPILFLTLMARLGYDKSYSSGTDPI